MLGVLRSFTFWWEQVAHVLIVESQAIAARLGVQANQQLASQGGSDEFLWLAGS